MDTNKISEVLNSFSQVLGFKYEEKGELIMVTNLDTNEVKIITKDLSRSTVWYWNCLIDEENQLIIGMYLQGDKQLFNMDLSVRSKECFYFQEYKVENNLLILTSNEDDEEITIKVNKETLTEIEGKRNKSSPSKLLFGRAFSISIISTMNGFYISK